MEIVLDRHVVIQGDLFGQVADLTAIPERMRQRIRTVHHDGSRVWNGERRQDFQERRLPDSVCADD